MKNIKNYNAKMVLHGYQARYLFDKLWYRYNRKNGLIIGYSERHEKVFGDKETTYNII
jgi:hypothetical protein